MSSQPISRFALLHSVSISAMMVATAAPRVAQAAPFRSLNQALAVAGRAAQLAVAPSNGVTASKQAALGAQNVARAATRFRSLADALSNPSSIAGSPSPIVVDGYGAGTGLQVLNQADGKTPVQWLGASTPTTAQANGATTVTVAQNQQLAQLTWKTFNVGAKTTLNFDQSNGGSLASSWVVINTVQDPQANASQILGSINAQGKVYVLNRNGIAFTKGATINVGSLIAATSDIAAAQFSTTTSGLTTFNLYGAQGGQPNDAVSGKPVSYAPTFVNGTTAAITVDPGAVIQTNAPTGTNGGGYVMLLGGNVTNQGIISTPIGQTILAAGTSFTLRQGTTGSTTIGNITSTTLGSEVATTNYGTTTTGVLTIDPTKGTYSTGSVINGGIVVADKGDISLIGHALTQSGVLLSTTTVNQRGTIHFLTPLDGSDPASSVTFAQDSITEILPEANGETALDSQRTAGAVTSATLNNLRTLPPSPTTPMLNNTNALADQITESRVEVSTGGSVDVGPGALVLAQGGQIAVGGGSRIVLEAGATLDVSGTSNSVLAGNVNALDVGSTGNTATALSNSVRALLVNVQPFQLRDSAANRTGGLKGTNVYVDASTLVEIASGAYAGNIYTPGGLLEVSGYLGLVPHSIGEWTAVGGQVTLQAQQTTLKQNIGMKGMVLRDVVTTKPGAIVTDPASVINLQGGTVTYGTGPVAQTYVQAVDGTVYNINTAPGDLVYTGLYLGAQSVQPRWKTTFTYVNPLLTPATITEPGYTVGRDAGSIIINSGNSSIQGAIYAGVTIGEHQNSQRPSTVNDPYLLAQTVVPQAGTLEFGNYLTSILQTFTTNTQVTFQATPGPSAVGTQTGTSQVGTGLVGASTAGTAQMVSIFDAAVVNADGFANIVLSTGGDVSVNAPISVADGGTISLTGANVAVNANITARAGAITLTDQLATFPGPVAKKTSVTLASGAVLDVRGVWTNEKIDPAHLAGAGYANAGRVTVASAGGVALAAGSRVDVSSGGGILPGGQSFTGRGGSIYVTANIANVTNVVRRDKSPLVLDTTFVGYGSNGGGTLSLSAPRFQIGTGPVIAANTTGIDPSLFSLGFSKYVINGTSSVRVLPGAQVTVVQPIYELDQGLALPSGSDPSSAYAVALPLLFTPTKGSDVLTPRGGASISLFSSTGGAGGLFPNQGAQFGGGPILVGPGANVTVDPQQSITVAGFGQVSVFGTLTAHGGNVTVANTNGLTDNGVPSDPRRLAPSLYQPGVSVWLNTGAVIDVSGQLVVQTDFAGRRFGTAFSGGTITLGSLPGLPATMAQVIVRPGAVLNADGAQAAVDVVPNAEPPSLVQRSNPVTLVGNGGTISADSITGVALDGTVDARAGGAGAAGGTLALTLDVSTLQLYFDIPTYVYQPQQILLSQNYIPTQNDPLLKPGQISKPDTFGLIRASQQQIDEGGFASLVLTAQTAGILFEGPLSLHTSQSIVLSAPIIGAAGPGANVSITAPYVGLYGARSEVLPLTGGAPVITPRAASFATLTVQGDLIEQSGQLFIGGEQPFLTGFSSDKPLPPGFGSPTQSFQPDVLGFGQVNLQSTGDIRFLGGDAAGVNGEFVSFGNISLHAAQVTPGSFRTTEIVAGQNPADPSGSTFPRTAGGTITIEGTGATPQAPYDVGGALSFIADTLDQAGIIRAPEGTITFTDAFNGAGPVYPSQVTFAPGSITSVSLVGQSVPYGGTADGVTYTPPGGGTPISFNPIVTVQAQSVNVQQGATIDLRGGGTLTGAGFVFGRGGSADVLTTPLLDTTGGTVAANLRAQQAVLDSTQGAAGAVSGIQPVRTGDSVYAILPGYASSYAPATVSGDSAYTQTKIGQQITVGGNVPGLAAGTYTLLPAYYALLPGAYRVELTTGTLPAGTNLTQGNFTSISPVTISTANTGIVSPVATAALFTSGKDVRQLSQYDEESYNAFEAASATQFGAPRPFLPQDAKTLQLNYPSAIGTQVALTFAPSALLKDAPGGYGATLEIGFAGTATGNNTIVVAGKGNPEPTVLPNELVLQSSTLSDLDVARLVLGGTVAPNPRSGNVIDVTASADGVYVLPNARLTAGDILIATTLGGQIAIEPGGTISTIGAGPSAYDSGNGFFFTTNDLVASGQAAPALDISNGQVNFLPTTEAANNASIVIGDGSGVLAGGSLDILAPTSTQVLIGQANLGAKSANIAVAAINIGSQAALNSFAGQLPQGFSVTPQALAALLNGNAALATPAASQLTLTATQEVNIIGSVALDSGSTDLVLNTPAIYGVGTASDAASITAPRFTWSGVATQVTTNGGTQTVSSLPGGQIAAGLNGKLLGTLSITAGTILLGNAPQTLTDNQVLLQRDVAGFANVILTGTTEITANNKSALGVYTSEPSVGQAGTGGNLSLISPLITTENGAVLNLEAGSSVSVAAPPNSGPAATGAVTTLGGQIGIISGVASIDTAIALPAGQFVVTAQGGISLGQAASIDLAGRTLRLADQPIQVPGGTLAFESTAGTIMLDMGSRIDVSSPGAAAGSVSLNALAGEVALNGSLAGTAASGQTGGSFTVIAGTLATTTQAGNVAAGGTALDNINAGLNAGGFTASRSFEFGTDSGPSGAAATDIVIGNDTAGAALLRASVVRVTADLGSIDVAGTINASGAGPGSIALNAFNNLTLEAGATLDAHANSTAVDSYNQPIDAENRAHVTLTSAHGTLTLHGGTVDLTYPGDHSLTGTPQGQLVLNAPRTGVTSGDVQINAAAPLSVTGAQSIALYAWTTYTAPASNGTIAETSNTPNVLGLVQIDAANQTFMENAAMNASLAARLAGLSSYGTTFHLRPGVEIDSTNASNGVLTINGDIDLSRFRYSDSGYGNQVTSGVYGSGEAGAVLFRAAKDLVVNGSVTDGFAPPADKNPNNYLPADASWVILTPSIANTGGYPNPLGADVILPSSLTVVEKSGKVVHQVELTAGTTFDETRAISLNYDIVVQSANISANVVIPFSATIDPASTGVVVPAGGFVTTAAITPPGKGAKVIPAGTYLPAGTLIQPGSTFAKNSVFPTAVQAADANGQLRVPAGTLLTIFDDAINPNALFSTLTLAVNTAPLPVNALIPSNTVANFAAPDGTALARLDTRPVGKDVNGNPVQGYLYALGALLPPGSQSWNLDFVAGANQASADVNAVQPRSALNNGALAIVANTANQAPGSLILDDEHYVNDPPPPPLGTALASPAFSVIRTGTGDLTLEAGGNFDQSSLYGIYTAGTQTQLPGGAAANAPYNLTRENFNNVTGRNGVLPGGPKAHGNRIIAETYQANYPNGGGDVVVAAQGSVTGDVYGGGGSGATVNGAQSPFLASDLVGNWLWRQGGSGIGQSTAWWINFGTLLVAYGPGEAGYNDGLSNVQLTGFQGIGALGGGNVTVTAGTDAGQITDRTGISSTSAFRGEGIIVAVGSTGRVVSSTNGTQSIVETGGGNLTLHVGGTLNPLDGQAFGLVATGSTNAGESDLNGAITNLRGAINVSSGAIGRLDQTYTSPLTQPDPRPVDPSQAVLVPFDGITIIPGDSTVTISTRGDLVLDGVGDPGRTTEQNLTLVTQAQVGTFSTAGGATGFSLWTKDTSVSLISAGGNVAPITVTAVPAAAQDANANDAPTDGRFVYPSQLYVTAATGNITYGSTGNTNQFSLETAPSMNEQVSFLAGGSIQANGMAVDLSGADPAGLSTPFDPAFATFIGVAVGAPPSVTNIRTELGTTQSPLALFALVPDNPTANYLNVAVQATPARFYAGTDILNFVSGETITFNSTANETLPQWYLAAKSVWIIAGRDIVNSGTRPSFTVGPLQQNQQASPIIGGFPSIGSTSGNLFLNNNTVSLVSAGRDVLSGYFYAGGSGLLEVNAGRNIQQIDAHFTTPNGNIVQQLDYGSIKSIGSLLSGAPVSLTGGSDVLVSAGLTAQPDAALAALYLNPANLADPKLQITDKANNGKVQFVYTAADLSAETLTQIGYAGQTDFLAFFNTLSPALQGIVARDIYFKELLASGQQYNDPASRFFHSYARGRQAIDAFFPGAGGNQTSSGNPAGYAGTITMASGALAATGSTLIDAGVATEHGGNIQVLDPGGPVILGTTGSTAPGGGTGLITNGSGNIDVFSQGSDLLGKSRIFTNAGGNIQIWSAAGDINAGIGARTSVVFNPPLLSYDNAGGIVESPAVPTSGSGIATNQPLPSVPAGNIDLTAPLGTIDAGEAGVRSAGNLNLAAARLANTSGFSAGGKTTGNAAAPSFSLGSVEAAGAAAGAGQQAAQNLGGSRTENQLPSVIEVEVLGISGESEEERRKKRHM